MIKSEEICHNNVSLTQEERSKLLSIINILNDRENNDFFNIFLETCSLYNTDYTNKVYALERRKDIFAILQENPCLAVKMKLEYIYNNQLSNVKYAINNNREYRRQELMKKLRGIIKKIYDIDINEFKVICKSLQERDVVVGNVSKMKRHSLETYTNIIDKLPLRMSSSMKNIINVDNVGHLWLKAPNPKNATDENPVKYYLISTNPYDYYARKEKYIPKSFMIIEGSLNPTFMKVEGMKIPTYYGQYKIITDINSDWFDMETNNNVFRF